MCQQILRVVLTVLAARPSREQRQRVHSDLTKPLMQLQKLKLMMMMLMLMQRTSIRTRTRTRTRTTDNNVRSCTSTIKQCCRVIYLLPATGIQYFRSIDMSLSSLTAYSWVLKFLYYSIGARDDIQWVPKAKPKNRWAIYIRNILQNYYILFHCGKTANQLPLLWFSKHHFAGGR